MVEGESITTIVREMLQERLGDLAADREWELRRAILDACALFAADLS